MPEKSAFWAVWRSSFTFCDNLSQNTVRAKRPPGAGRRFRRVAASAKTGGRRRECTHADVSGKKLICVRRLHKEEGAFAQPVRRRRGCAAGRIPLGGSRQNRWPTPGVHRRWCQRGKTACARRPHEEEGISLNRFGGVGGAAGRIPFAAGELGALCTLAPWPKYMAAGTRVSGCWFWPRGQTCRAGVSADKPAAPFCLMPGSHILL